VFVHPHIDLALGVCPARPVFPAWFPLFCGGSTAMRQPCIAQSPPILPRYSGVFPVDQHPEAVTAVRPPTLHVPLLYAPLHRRPHGCSVQHPVTPLFLSTSRPGAAVSPAACVCQYIAQPHACQIDRPHASWRACPTRRLWLATCLPSHGAWPAGWVGMVSLLCHAGFPEHELACPIDPLQPCHHRRGPGCCRCHGGVVCTSHPGAHPAFTTAAR